MATSSHPGPVIYSIGNVSGDPNINKIIEERMKELLEKLKDTQSIIYVNIENLQLECRDMHRGRSRSRSKSRDLIRSRSQSRSRSHSLHRKGKHVQHHRKGHRSQPHFLHRRRHHHWGHHYPPYYYSSEVEETNCDLTTEESTEENKVTEPCCKRECRHHGRWHRRYARSRSKSNGRKHGKGCAQKVNNAQTKEPENLLVNTIDEEEQKNPVIGEDLDKQFDSLNVSKVP